MSHLLIRGDARHLPLADRSVHAVICSPPFFGLRAYLDADDPSKALEIGTEPTPGEFVEAMRVVARQVWRVLRDDGCFWLNLGDSFNSSPSNQNNAFPSSTCSGGIQKGSANGVRKKREIPGLKPTDLCLIPERVALALQADGWFVRAKPPWIKHNSMPESCRSRPNTAHESIFMLTKSSRYYFDMDSVRIPLAGATVAREVSGYKHAFKAQFVGSPIDFRYPDGKETDGPISNPDGRHLRTNDFADDSLDALIAHHEGYLDHLRNVRDSGGLLLSEAGDPLAIWCSTVGFPGSHYATWPPKLVEPMVRASTSQAGVCPECGGPWVRETERARIKRTGKVLANERDGGLTAQNGMDRTGLSHFKYNEWLAANPTQTIGWLPSCTCPAADPVPATVLDPFMGSGTTLMVARQLGRRAIGLDLDQDNFPMAEGRIADGLRPVSRLDPPPPIRPLAGQLTMFGEGGGG